MIAPVASRYCTSIWNLWGVTSPSTSFQVTGNCILWSATGTDTVTVVALVMLWPLSVNPKLTGKSVAVSDPKVLS